MVFDVTLTDEERDRWIDRMAEEVVKRRLESPAILVLEMHRPLSFLGSQALVVATPFLGAFVGHQHVLKLSRLLEDRQNIERLILRIEERSGEAKPVQAPPEPEPGENKAG